MRTNFILKKQLLLVAFLICLTSITKAQISNARVMFTPATTGYDSAAFQLTLSDSIGFSDIEIQLHELVEDTTIFIGVFAFDQTTGLPSGWTWAREGTRVSMGMGVLPEGNAWKAKVRIKSNVGIWGEYLEFLFN
jgi:hypothetical protein